DPLNDFTVFFNVVDKNDQDHMNAFLQSLKDRGVEVVVALTDGNPPFTKTRCKVTGEVSSINSVSFMSSRRLTN
ncbi:hypothetical protein C2W62_53535, partial [Candidatus Entotheonella serta]